MSLFGEYKLLILSFLNRYKCLLSTDRDTPHESKYIIDGHIYVDPIHAKFKVRNDKDKRITTAHYHYPEPLGGRHVWYSKESLNGGASSSAYWVYDGPAEQTSSSGKGKEKSKK